MKKFEIVFILIFLQLSFVIVGQVEITPGHTLIAPYIDASFLNAISGLGNSYNTLQTNIQQLNLNNIFTPQPFTLCIINNVCSPPINIPGYGFLNTLGNMTMIMWNLGMLVLTVFTTSIIFAGAFYTAILLTVLPANTSLEAFATIIGLTLGLIQMTLLLWDILTSIKGLSFGVENSLQFNLEDQTITLPQTKTKK